MSHCSKCSGSLESGYKFVSFCNLASILSKECGLCLRVNFVAFGYGEQPIDVSVPSCKITKLHRLADEAGIPLLRGWASNFIV